AKCLVERFGAGGFVYAGNDSTDLAIWRVASKAVLVNASPTLSSKARAIIEVEQEFQPAPTRIRLMIKAMRPHQWAKTVLFFLAALYTIRIFAGGVVSGHMVTEWLVGFSIFMFLSLALAKRVAELLGTQARSGGQPSRRAYADQDIAILQTMGVASAFVSAL